MIDALAAATDVEPFVTELRHDLHAHPEICLLYTSPSPRD